MNKVFVSLVLASAAVLAAAGSAWAQGQVEIRATTPDRGKQLEIVQPSPATREATRPREADFYREDVRVRHEPAFIEPFVTTTKGGTKVGLSGWTSPPAPGGSANVAHNPSNGWFALGITFIWDSPPPAAPASR